MRVRVEAPKYLTERCCLTCGFRGRELQGRRGAERLTCPQCRQDLYARPARSYAEMEGLSQPHAPAATTGPIATNSPTQRRVSLLRLAGGLLGKVGLLLIAQPKRRRGPARSRQRTLVAR